VTTYLSKEQILDRQRRTVEADAKAADPATLSAADLSDLSTEKLSELLNAGHLTHLGLGKPKIRRRG
jgi:hypothetical protein